MTARHWLKQRPWIHVWLPVAAWMGLIFYLSAQPDLPHPGVGWADLLVSSSAHAIVFGVLALLWTRALGKRPRAPALALALTMLYALSDELHQAFVPGRHPDAWDLLCDGLGAALGTGLWLWLQNHSRTQRAGELPTPTGSD